MKKTKSSTDIRLGTRAEVAARRAQEELQDASNDVINLSSLQVQTPERPTMPESRNVRETGPSVSAIEIMLCLSIIAAIVVAAFILFGSVQRQQMSRHLTDSMTSVSSTALLLSGATPSDQLQTATWTKGRSLRAAWASDRPNHLVTLNADFVLNVRSYTSSSLPPQWSAASSVFSLLDTPSATSPIVMEVAAFQVPVGVCETLVSDLSPQTIGVAVNTIMLGNTPTGLAIAHACAAAERGGSVMKVRALYAVPSGQSPSLAP